MNPSPNVRTERATPSLQDQADLIEDLFQRTTHYTQTSAELIKLKIIDKSANVISALIARLLMIVVFTLSFLVLNIGLALWIGQLLGESYLGFFTVAGFYVLLGIVLLFRNDKWIKKPLQNFIVIQAQKSSADE